MGTHFGPKTYGKRLTPEMQEQIDKIRAGLLGESRVGMVKDCIVIGEITGKTEHFLDYVKSAIDKMDPDLANFTAVQAFYDDVKESSRRFLEGPK